MEVRHKIVFSYHKNTFISIVGGKGTIMRVQRQTDLQSKEQKKHLEHKKGRRTENTRTSKIG